MTDHSPTDSRAVIAADPREALPRLHQLLAAYFDQDWSVEHEDWTAVVGDFLADSSDAVVAATAADLRRLIAAGFDESGLRQLLEGLDCYLDPSGVGLDTATWLGALLAQLDG